MQVRLMRRRKALTKSDYQAMVRYAGSHLASVRPWPVPATTPFAYRCSVAIYIVCDVGQRCCYVGSVARRKHGGLESRIAEHLADHTKRSTWHTVWVLPLREDTPIVEVRRLEGVVGAHLGPRASRRLPKPRPPYRQLPY